MGRDVGEAAARPPFGGTVPRRRWRLRNIRCVLANAARSPRRLPPRRPLRCGAPAAAPPLRWRAAFASLRAPPLRPAGGVGSPVARGACRPLGARGSVRCGGRFPASLLPRRALRLRLRCPPAAFLAVGALRRRRGRGRCAPPRGGSSRPAPRCAPARLSAPASPRVLCRAAAAASPPCPRSSARRRRRRLRRRLWRIRAAAPLGLGFRALRGAGAAQGGLPYKRTRRTPHGCAGLHKTFSILFNRIYFFKVSSLPAVSVATS